MYSPVTACLNFGSDWGGKSLHQWTPAYSDWYETVLHHCSASLTFTATDVEAVWHERRIVTQLAYKLSQIQLLPPCRRLQILKAPTRPTPLLGRRCRIHLHYVLGCTSIQNALYFSAVIPVRSFSGCDPQH